MPKAKQFSVACENRPGALAEVARTLGDARVSIEAFSVGVLGSEGRVNLVVDSPARARRALTAAGMSFSEEDVLLVELPHRPGTLAEFAAKLAARDINIEAAYASAVKGRRARVIFAVSDIRKASRVR